MGVHVVEGWNQTADLVRAVELQMLREKLCGTVLRRSASPDRGALPAESLHLHSDGGFVREVRGGAGACLRARGRWAVEEFLDAPMLVLREAGTVATFLPLAAGAHDVALLGGVAWTREARD